MEKRILVKTNASLVVIGINGNDVDVYTEYYFHRPIKCNGHYDYDHADAEAFLDECDGMDYGSEEAKERTDGLTAKAFLAQFSDSCFVAQKCYR